ncbi:GNAT family N-acetyltransferase [Halosquirtibacter laminarini]|uniref:GNAT family N-acetyltransferase n=1 Tax=Halosquirtibacter laminarini TaxID=3374600 RepID=A0AC61NDK0_9BACT|nr:GNAT family N-acetyltransferase [Prolixibacteraceae bacterium]
MKSGINIDVVVANETHIKYVDIINNTIERASKERGTGIAKRTYGYVANKIQEGKAVIALHGDTFAGFCYIESWGHNKFVANSGLIVDPEFRGCGLAKRIKKCAFDLSRTKFPDAKIFGLTTGLPVMKINSELGYRPVTFSELTDDEAFWNGCKSCVNYDILERTSKSKCLCTGMLYDPIWDEQPQKSTTRWQRWKEWLKNRSDKNSTLSFFSIKAFKK